MNECGFEKELKSQSRNELPRSINVLRIADWVYGGKGKGSFTSCNSSLGGGIGGNFVNATRYSLSRSGAGITATLHTWHGPTLTAWLNAHRQRYPPRRWDEGDEDAVYGSRSTPVHKVFAYTSDLPFLVFDCRLRPLLYLTTNRFNPSIAVICILGPLSIPCYERELGERLGWALADAPQVGLNFILFFYFWY